MPKDVDKIKALRLEIRNLRAELRRREIAHIEELLEANEAVHAATKIERAAWMTFFKLGRDEYIATRH